MARPLRLDSAPVAQLNVHLPVNLLRTLKQFALNRRVTLRAVLQTAVVRLLREETGSAGRRTTPDNWPREVEEGEE